MAFYLAGVMAYWRAVWLAGVRAVLLGLSKAVL